MREVFSVFFCAITLTACGPVIIEPLGGGGGGGAGEPGGSVSLSLSSASGFDVAGASAWFIKSITGDTSGDTSGTTLDIDDCMLNEAATGGSGGDVTVEYFDVGETVTIEEGSSSIDLAKSDAGGTITYAPGGTVDATAVTPGADYDVILSGSADVDAQTWAGVLTVPDMVNVTSPDLSAPVSMAGGSALTIEWEPAGVGELFLFIGGQTSYSCRVNDDGSFEIPASIVDDVDQFGAISLGGSVIHSQDFSGRSVTLVGTTSIGGSYQK